MFVLFKDAPESDQKDAYATALAVHGNARHIPLLATTDTPRELETVWASLPDPCGEVHFLITSVRAARVVTAALPSLLRLPLSAATRRMVVHVWPLGPATAAPLDLLQLPPAKGRAQVQVHVPPASANVRDAASLAAYFIANGPHSTVDSNKNKVPVVFARGDKALDALPKALEAAGIPLITAVVYHTAERANWMSELAGDALDLDTWWVFFSPSGASIVANAFPDGPPPNVRIASIGETTAAQLRSLARTVHAVAARPTADALAEAIASADNNMINEK
ncbi:tetrapyrrole biosynthesis, uroporphyrinogen III synthase [Blastocladiella britannica]|nr:tetrapyrrole biosynthesis, uroporphyrinogen III synthase [Blastocladiella britannica]